MPVAVAACVCLMRLWRHQREGVRPSSGGSLRPVRGWWWPESHWHYVLPSCPWQLLTWSSNITTTLSWRPSYNRLDNLDYEEQKYTAESWAKVEWWRKSTANSNSCWSLEEENIMFSIQNLRLHQYPEPLPLTDHHYVSPGSQQVSRHLSPVHSVRAQC